MIKDIKAGSPDWLSEGVRKFNFRNDCNPKVSEAHNESQRLSASACAAIALNLRSNRGT